MKFLSGYFDFIIEAVAKKTMRLYYSDEFRDLLVRVSRKNNMAKLLLSAEDSNQISDIYTLIDVTDKNDTISFIQVNRILRAEPDTKTYPDSDVYFIPRKITNDKSNEFWHKGRTEIGIGRWLRRIVIDVYKYSISDTDIEKFVNQYKASFDGNDTNFEVVKGEDIRKWYLEYNYEIVKGQLGNSCMRYKRCQEYLDIYVKNPEVCSLLIMKSEDSPEKIVGRALLWNLTSGLKFQDRIYTIRDSDRELFEEWADKNDYKTYDDYYETSYVQLGNHEYEKYPYMDTFVCYNPTTKTLVNSEDFWHDKGYYLLQDTSGGFRSDDVVYSEWSDEYISRDRAVYCENVSGYLDREEARWLEYKNQWAAPNDDIVWSDYHDEWFYVDDASYSELVGDTLNPSYDSVIEVITTEYGDTDLCIKSRTDLYIEVDDKYYAREYCVKDPYTGEWRFKNKEYERELDEKLMAEFDIERSDKTLDRNGNVVTKVLDEVREDLKTRLLKLKISDDVKKDISENPIYIKQIRGVYWGLSKDDQPDEEDIFALIKSYMITKGGMRNDGYYSISYLSDLIGKFVFFRSEEMNKQENRFKRFHHAGILRPMLRCCKSFDFSKLPDDIYKRYLFTTI